MTPEYKESEMSTIAHIGLSVFVIFSCLIILKHDDKIKTIDDNCDRLATAYKQLQYQVDVLAEREK